MEFLERLQLEFLLLFTSLDKIWKNLQLQYRNFFCQVDSSATYILKQELITVTGLRTVSIKNAGPQRFAKKGEDLQRFSHILNVEIHRSKSEKFPLPHLEISISSAGRRIADQLFY